MPSGKLNCYSQCLLRLDGSFAKLMSKTKLTEARPIQRSMQSGKPTLPGESSFPSGYQLTTHEVFGRTLPAFVDLASRPHLGPQSSRV